MKEVENHQHIHRKYRVLTKIFRPKKKIFISTEMRDEDLSNYKHDLPCTPLPFLCWHKTISSSVVDPDPVVSGTFLPGRILIWNNVPDMDPDLTFLY